MRNKAFIAVGLLILMALPTGCGPKAAGDRALADWWTETVPRRLSLRDANQNGLSDTEDLIEGGRMEVRRRVGYRSVYYAGAYPPVVQGVCTDLVWRAYLNAGYDLKALIDKDIKNNLAAYPRVDGHPDPPIDFRRVPNQRVFFSRHGLSLTTELRPDDPANLAQWQAGDIVTFQDPDHVALVSPRRNARGVPYLIHQPGPRPVEADDLWPLYRRGRLTGHYRYPRD